jgi:LPS sulfotransferase NodH
MKVHWSHVQEARGRLARALWLHIDADPIQEIAPKAQLVWLRRHDRIRQAISAYRANATGRYVQRQGAPAPPATPVPFDFWAVHGRVEQVTTWNIEWLHYFAEVGFTPLELVYEQDLERDCRPAVRRVLAQIGVEIPEGVQIASPFRKQADALSEELLEQYLQEASRRGLPINPPLAAPPGSGPAPRR